MKYTLGRGDWQNMSQGESRCFLLTNGLGGYCSQTVIGSNARNDHGLLIAAKTAPSERWTMVSRLDEIIYVDGCAFDLASQSYVTKTQNRQGYRYLSRFQLDGLPEWEYMVQGVQVIKRLVLPYGTNSLAVSYEISSCPGQKAWLELTPVYGLHLKNEHPASAYPMECAAVPEIGGYKICANGEALYLQTDGELVHMGEEFIPGCYFEQDAADGREGFGSGMTLHRLRSGETNGEGRQTLSLLYGTDCGWMERAKTETDRRTVQGEDRSACLYEYVRLLEQQELERQKRIADGSGLICGAGRQLAVSAASFLTERESTQGKSIIAGFPFFGDWGRDTMIAFYGCTAALGDREAARSILGTFMQYCSRGIMPNLFPEGNQEPMYNTADASLLFLNAAWEYLSRYPDPELEREVLKTAEEIFCWYACGTDYNIHMDTDGLMIAGNGLWQLTWMDVRFGDILPTPRHGKPVEINAYWYNAVRILEELMRRGQSGYRPPDAGRWTERAPEPADGWGTKSCTEKAEILSRLAEQIKSSFLAKFTRPDGALYDVLPEEPADEKAMYAKGQIRCNQIFALSLPFSMIGQTQAQAILSQVRRELYTPLGLRSLSPKDPQFHPSYGGSQFERDMAYHQGTVWVYPLGAYYRACLRYAGDRKQEAAKIRRALGAIEAAMAEGCLGQLPEIYDGEFPAASRGCFAQAWSAAELLRVYQETEDLK